MRDSLLEKYRDHEIYYVSKSGQFQVYKDSLDCGFFETPAAAKKKIDALVRKNNRAKAANLTAFYKERYRDEEFEVVKVLSIGNREAYINHEGSRSKVALYELYANTPANEKIFAEIKSLNKQKEQIEARIEALEEKRAPLVPDEKEKEDA